MWVRLPPSSQKEIEKSVSFFRFMYFLHFLFNDIRSILVAPQALGIEATSFWSAAEKDIAESPARSERPKKTTYYIGRDKSRPYKLTANFQFSVFNFQFLTLPSHFHEFFRRFNYTLVAIIKLLTCINITRLQTLYFLA